MTALVSILKASLLAAVLLAFWAAPALAAETTTPSGLIQEVTVTQTSTEAGQATGAGIDTHLTRSDAGRPSPTTQISISFPAEMTRNTAAFATCDPAVLQAQGPRGCPSASRIGTGIAVGDASPVVNDPITAAVTIFNAPAGGFLLYVFPDLGPTYVLEGVPVGPSTIVFDVPPIPTVPAAPNAALRELSLRFVSTYLTNPPYCPTTGWTWGFSFTYESGEQVSVPVSVPCAGPPPPVEGDRSSACKAERERLGEVEFAARYGTNRSGRNALGKCVSAPGPLSP